MHKNMCIPSILFFFIIFTLLLFIGHQIRCASWTINDFMILLCQFCIIVFFFYFACLHSEHLKQINMCIQLQCSFQYIYDKTSVSTFLCSRSISIFTFVGRTDTYSNLLYARPANPRWSCCTSGRGAGDPRCLVF